MTAFYHCSDKYVGKWSAVLLNRKGTGEKNKNMLLYCKIISF